MNGQQSGYLPVNPERVEGPYYNGLPMNIPFQPQLNVPPHIQQIAGLTMGVLIMVLQDNAQKNPLRTFLFNLASMNNYRNETFEELLVTTLEYVDHLMAIQKYRRVEDAIDHAAKEVCAIMSSLNVQRFPALQRYITDQAMFNDVQGWINRYHQLAWEIQQTSQAAQPVHQQWQQIGGSFWPAQQQVWPAPALQQPWQSQWQPRTPAGQMAVGPASHHSYQPAHFPSWGSGSPQRGAPAPAAGLTGALERRSGQGQQSLRQAPPAFNRWEKEQPSQQRVEAVQDVRETAKEKGMNYDDFYKEDGSHWRPAFKSGWKKTPSLQQPYTPAYDPTKNILYHRRMPDGTVTEVLMEVNDNNEYLLYEMDPTFARRAREGMMGESAKVDWDQVGKAKTTDEIAEDRARRLKALQELNPDATEDDLPELEEPQTILHILSAASEAEAGLGAAMAYLNLHKELPTKSPLEYAYMLCTPMLADRPVKEELERLLNSKTLSEAGEVLNELSGKIPARIWHYINDRLTQAVNEALEVNLNSPSRMESFADDAGEVIDFVKENDGEHIALALAGHARDIIRGSAYVLQGEQLINYLEKLEFPAENQDQLMERIVVFGEFNVTTEVPWFSHEMNVELSGGAAAVLESRLPTLHKAIARIIGRNSRLKGNKPRNNYIVTKDNVRLKVYEGWIGKDFYLIKKV